MMCTDVYTKCILCLNLDITKITFITRVISYMFGLNMPPNVYSIFHFFPTLRARPGFVLCLTHHRRNKILYSFNDA